ncbi:MAG: TonB-dependent receptor, partial [Porticoccaceae bacterium]
LAPVLLFTGFSPCGYASDIKEIVVSAQKRLQPEQEIPVSLSVLSSEDLTRRSISTVFDLQYSVPALAVRQNQSATTANFSIRGIGTAGSNFGLESSVGLYVDGVYRARQNAMINELVDMERVEVLRGPQGTLFGRNTPSGAVLLNTVAPSHHFGGYLDLGAGNLDLFTLSGAVGGSLVDDFLAVRFTGFTARRDGYMDDIALGDNVINDRDRAGGRFQFLVTPNDDMSLRLIADYSRIDEACCGAVTVKNNYLVYSRNNLRGGFSPSPSPGTDTVLSLPSSALVPGTPIPGFGAQVIDQNQIFDDVVSFTHLPESGNRDTGLSAEFNWNLAGGEFTSISAFRRFESSDYVDGDFSSSAIVSRREDAEQEAFSQELRFNFSSRQVDAIIGGYYFQQNLDTQSHTLIGEDANNFVSLAVFSDAAALAEQAGLAVEGGDVVNAALLQRSAQQAVLTATAIYAGLENVPLSSDHPLFSLQQAGYRGHAFPAGAGSFNQMAQDHQAWAIFGQLDYHIASKLTLTTGVRYTVEDKHIDGFFTEPGASWGKLLALDTLTIVNARPDVHENLDDERLTGTIKLSWLPSRDLLLFISYATGYKSGGTNTDRINPALSTVFGAESATTFEAGFKADFPNQNLRINLALHHSRVKDHQTNSFQGTGFNLANAGKLVTKGGELELWWHPFDSLSLSGAYIYSRGEFEGFDSANCWISFSWLTGVDDPGRSVPLARFCDRSGGALDNNPQNNLILVVTQVFPLNNGGEIYVRGDYNYRDAMFMDTNLDPYKRQSGYAIVNARAGLRLSQQQVEIALWSRNLLNEDYLYVYYDVPLQPGKLNAYPSEPRTYGLEVIKRF